MLVGAAEAGTVITGTGVGAAVVGVLAGRAEPADTGRVCAGASIVGGVPGETAADEGDGPVLAGDGPAEARADAALRLAAESLAMAGRFLDSVVEGVEMRSWLRTRATCMVEESFSSTNTLRALSKIKTHS